jgi:hypothetical protein
MFQKTERIEDEAYREYIRSQPCFVTNSRQRSEMAHLRVGSKTGGAQRPNDFDSHPLHPTEHRLQHQIGEISYWRDALCTNSQALVECVQAAGRLRFLKWLASEGRESEITEMLKRF